MYLKSLALAAVCLVVFNLAAHADQMIYFHIAGSEGLHFDGIDQNTGDYDSFAMPANPINGEGSYDATTNTVHFDSLTGANVIGMGKDVPLVNGVYDYELFPYFADELSIDVDQGAFSGKLSFDNLLPDIVQDPDSGDMVAGRLEYQGAALFTATTPEPTSFALLSTGLLGVAGALRRRNKFKCV